MNPIFTIITVSYNAEETIAGTVQSCLAQTFRDFEIIIKDGMSKDDTLKRIPTDKRIKVIQKKDLGIYDAMNQAIDMSEGKYIIFMNCGDEFASKDVLEKVHKQITSLPSTTIIYGDFNVDGVTHKQPSLLTDSYLYRTPLNHQSMFFSKSIFDQIGIYDTKYRILADYNLTLKCFFSKVCFKHVDVTVSKYLRGGVSETKEGNKKKNEERKIILKEYYKRKHRIRYDFVQFITLRKFRMWLFAGHSPKWFVVFYRRIVNKING